MAKSLNLRFEGLKRFRAGLNEFHGQKPWSTPDDSRPYVKGGCVTLQGKLQSVIDLRIAGGESSKFYKGQEGSCGAEIHKGRGTIVLQIMNNCNLLPL